MDVVLLELLLSRKDICGYDTSFEEGGSYFYILPITGRTRNGQGFCFVLVNNSRFFTDRFKDSFWPKFCSCTFSVSTASASSGAAKSDSAPPSLPAGTASSQPHRTRLSKEEIESILVMASLSHHFPIQTRCNQDGKAVSLSQWFKFTGSLVTFPYWLSSGYACAAWGCSWSMKLVVEAFEGLNCTKHLHQILSTMMAETCWKILPAATFVMGCPVPCYMNHLCSCVSRKLSWNCNVLIKWCSIIWISTRVKSWRLTLRSPCRTCMNWTSFCGKSFQMHTIFHPT